MLKKIYINNFRCLQNFDISFEELETALILGGNGSGKSNFFTAVELFQKIGLGVVNLKDLITKDDFAFGDTSKPMTLELQVELEKQAYQYRLEIDWPDHFRQPKVRQETLKVDGKTMLNRDEGKTQLNQYGSQAAEFTLDWHHIGLPLISTRNEQEPIALLRTWLASILVLSPVPSLFEAVSKGEELYLRKNANNLLDWLRYMLAESPASYKDISEFIQERMADFDLFKFDATGKDEKELLIRFKSESAKALELNFSQLSDGEKIYFLTATVLAAIDNDIPRLCLWDEPDNFVSLPELSQFIAACRKRFTASKKGSQLIVTSHNSRVINSFSGHNTYFLSRKTHFHPSRVELLSEKKYLSPTLIEAYENGELEDGSE